jgi:hypothetical protein
VKIALGMAQPFFLLNLSPPAGIPGLKTHHGLKQGGRTMNISIGIVLVLSLMVLIFLGPEWMGTFGRKPKRFKKRVRIARDSRLEPLVGRRKNNRPVTSQSPS